MDSEHMDNDKNIKNDLSYGTVLKEMGNSIMRLFQSEIDLIKAEIKETSRDIGKHSARAALCGALLAISIFPLLAFLVIGLGKLLQDQYWLSSLLIGVFCAAIGGVLTLRSVRKMKNQDFTLPLTRQTLQDEKTAVSKKVEELKDLTRRRAA